MTRARHAADRGHAMLIVLLLGVLFVGLWIAVHRATRDASTVQIAGDRREVFEERITRALVFAGHLLESGRPRQPTFEFVYAAQDSGGPFHTTVMLTRNSNTRYDAEARPATQQEIARLPQNPRNF